MREIRRVLRPGGALVLTWNMESRRAPWVAALRDVYEAYDGGIPQYRRGQWREVFAHPETRALFPGPLQTKVVLQEMLITKAQAWERVKSKSYISALPPGEMGLVRERVQDVLDGHDDAFHLVRPDDVGRRYARQPIETEVTYVLAAPAVTPPFPLGVMR